VLTSCPVNFSFRFTLQLKCVDFICVVLEYSDHGFMLIHKSYEIWDFVKEVHAKVEFDEPLTFNRNQTKVNK
jgi:hypothetical protein